MQLAYIFLETRYFIIFDNLSLIIDRERLNLWDPEVVPMLFFGVAVLIKST